MAITSYGDIGFAYSTQRDLARASGAFDALATLERTYPTRYLLANGLAGRAQLAVMNAQTAALDDVKGGRLVCRVRGDDIGAARFDVRAGLIALSRRDIGEAESLVHAALRTFSDRGFRREVVVIEWARLVFGQPGGVADAASVTSWAEFQCASVIVPAFWGSADQAICAVRDIANSAEIKGNLRLE